jgi:peptide/nickel transport system substrate-binding protein
MLDLDFYASYEMKSQVLMAGEVWATINGASAMIAQTQIKAANVFSGQPNPTTSQCLIATASYGSAFAPQVQFLRDFRDQKIDRTFAGYSFMTAFNLWYYSFSPAVAGTINVSPQLQSIMQILLYPLITILQLSASVFDAFSFQPELAAVIAGLVATALLGVVYLWIPLIIATRRFKTEIKRSLKPLATILCAATVALAGSEIFGNSLIAVISSVVLVLANLLLFAALPGIFPNRNSIVHCLTKRRT